MSYPIAKFQVVEAVNAVYEEAIRQKIDQWTDQVNIQLLEWAQKKGYLASHSPSPEELITLFKASSY